VALQACVPRVIRYHAPWDLPDWLENVALPEGIKGQSQSDQQGAIMMIGDVAAKNMEKCVIFLTTSMRFPLLSAQ